MKEGALVLFQGDSITDSGRNFEVPDDLGAGYAAMIAGWCAASSPGLRLRFLNRGVGGDRTKDLKERWKRDCLELKPDWVSIFVGINDCWRRYDSNDPTSPGEFEANYRDILVRTSEIPGVKPVLMEPFVVPYPADRQAWREDLDPKIEIVHGLAREFGAKLVPLDALFRKACRVKPPVWWAGDGVHPSTAGHMLIAHAWMETMGLVLPSDPAV